MTREFGFHSHPDFTGGELSIVDVPVYKLKKGQKLNITFLLPAHNQDQFVGFGGWFSAPSANMKIHNPNYNRNILKYSPQPDWGKVGSMWISDGKKEPIQYEITAPQDCSIAIWNMQCGSVSHAHLEEARAPRLRNMYEFAPEALFITNKGQVIITVNGFPAEESNEKVSFYLKSCNRCGRFLPINIHNERLHLSFTNHCTAKHRIPCSHTGFGKLTNITTKEVLKLNHGYQLECRFCKKFEVNAAHNPKRTSAQMKEDGTRRRAIEFLLSELYQDSSQISYRSRTGSELAIDIWKRFDRKCFNCGKRLRTPFDMNLDHTRPLALMWPLDRSATALCKSCNNEKRDRPPSEFYSEEQLKDLSQITEIPFEELVDPSPNVEAIASLLNNLDWFFNEFLTNPRMTRELDGKVPADLLVKALQKTINKLPGGAPVDLIDEHNKRQK